jgi:hypothetical protein
VPLVPEGTTAGGTTNFRSSWRGVTHGAKRPDSKPPFTRTGAQVLLALVEVEEEVVDKVTVVRVDDVMTA